MILIFGCINLILFGINIGLNVHNDAVWGWTCAIIWTLIAMFKNWDAKR